MACHGARAKLFGYFTGIVTEGGYLGCIAVLGTFATCLTWASAIKGLAVMLPTLQEQFDAPTWLVGWMIAIIDSTVDLAGPFAPVLGDRFGVSLVFMISGVVIGASFICSAFVSSLATMAAILSIFVGPTLGIANILSRDLIGRCFDKYYTTAYGLGALGSSVAFVIFAPLTQFFLDLYGWKATMMLLGAIFSHLTVCGALLNPREKTTSSRGSNQAVGKDCDQRAVDDQEDGASRWSRLSNQTSVLKLIAANLHLDLFSSVHYWLITCVTVMTTMTYTAWMIYFVPYVTISKGYSLVEAANFVLIFGIGKILGNLLVGQTVTACGVIGLGADVCMLIANIVMTIYLFVDPWLTYSWAVSLGAFLYGCFNSFLYILCDVITKEVIGVDQLGSALGWIGLKTGVIKFAFLFFPGLVFDTLSSYTVAFIILGGVNVLSFFAQFTLIWLQRRHPDSAS